MDSYYLTCRSLTYAQRLSRALNSAGIRNSLVRTPNGMSNDGCGYSVKIKSNVLNDALAAMRYSSMMPKKIFYSYEDGNYQEVLF